MFFYCHGIVQHKRICSRIVAASVEMKRADGKAHLLLHFPNCGVFGVLPEIYISCDKDIAVLSVLFYQIDFVFFLIHHYHADSAVEKRISELSAVFTPGDIFPLVLMISELERSPAFYAIVHLHTAFLHVDYMRNYSTKMSFCVENQILL